MNAPSWESAEAWEAAARRVNREGKVATVATICPDCLRAIPRTDDMRLTLVARCLCGPTTTAALDHDAHGIRSVQNYISARVTE